MIQRSSKVRYVALALVAGLSLASCGKGCGKQGAAGKTESLSLIPADSNVVIGMNWKKLQDSPLGAKMNQGVPAEAQPFLKDIDSIVLGIKVEGAERDAKELVGVVSGKLDSAAMLKQMNDQAAKSGTTVQTEDYEGIKIYSTAKDQGFGVALLDGQAVFGKIETVKKSLDLIKKKGDSLEKNKAMMDLIGGVDKTKMMWAVGTIPEGALPAGGGGGMANPMSALSTVKAIDLALDYNQNLTLDLGILTGTKDDAQQLMTMANSYKTLFGASLASKSPELGKILGSLSIDAKENKVILTLKIDQATVEDLANKAKAAGAGMPMGGMDEGAPAPGGPDAMAPSAPAAPAAPAAPSAPAAPAAPSAP